MCPRGTSKFTKHDRPCKGKVSNARTMLPRNPNKAAAGIAPPTQAPDAAAFPQRAPAAASTRRKLPGLAQPSPIKTSSGSFNVPFMCKPPPRELLGLVQDPDPAGVDPTAAGHVIPGSLVKGELPLEGMSKAQKKNLARHKAKRAAARKGGLTALPESDMSRSDVGAALSDVGSVDDAWAYEASAAQEITTFFANPANSRAAAQTDVSSGDDSWAYEYIDNAPEPSKTPAAPVTAGTVVTPVPSAAWVTDLDIYNKLLGLNANSVNDVPDRAKQGDCGLHDQAEPHSNALSMHGQAALGASVTKGAAAAVGTLPSSFSGPCADSSMISKHNSVPALDPASYQPSASLNSSSRASQHFVGEQHGTNNLWGSVQEVQCECDSDSEGDLDLSELMGLLVT